MSMSKREKIGCGSVLGGLLVLWIGGAIVASNAQQARESATLTRVLVACLERASDRPDISPIRPEPVEAVIDCYTPISSMEPHLVVYVFGDRESTYRRIFASFDRIRKLMFRAEVRPAELRDALREEAAEIREELYQ